MKLDKTCQQLFDLWNQDKIKGNETDPGALEFHNLVLVLDQNRKADRKLKREREKIGSRLHELMVQSGIDVYGIFPSGFY